MALALQTSIYLDYLSVEDQIVQMFYQQVSAISLTFVSKHMRCRPVMHETLWPGGRDQGGQDVRARQRVRVVLLLCLAAAVPAVQVPLPQMLPDVPRLHEND